ncbi:hypothetical protein H8E88_34745 [candidate division KSB1 bacterium]|nr:hypothetical protein [candidate division KSB1 bacterium]
MKYFLELFLFMMFFLLVLTLQCRKNATNVQNEMEDCGSTDMSLFVPSDTTGEFVLITGVRIRPMDEGELDRCGLDNYFARPSLKNGILFAFYTEYKYIDSTEIPYQIDSSQLADMNHPKVINRVNSSHSNCALRFSKDIKYKGQLIPAFENVLIYDDGDLDIYFSYTLSPFTVHMADLKKEFFEFEKGCYEVYAEWHTIFDETISDTVMVYIDVN